MSQMSSKPSTKTSATVCILYVLKAPKKEKIFHILPPAGGRHATEVTSVNASYF